MVLAPLNIWKFFEFCLYQGCAQYKYSVNKIQFIFYYPLMFNYLKSFLFGPTVQASNMGDLSLLSRKAFGRELAEKFVNIIHTKSAYCPQSHQGYCGWIAGFQEKEQQFAFARSWEGYVVGDYYHVKLL